MAKGVLERNTVSFSSFIRQFEHQRSTGYRFETTGKNGENERRKKKRRVEKEEGEERIHGGVLYSPPRRVLCSTDGTSSGKLVTK